MSRAFRNRAAPCAARIVIAISGFIAGTVLLQSSALAAGDSAMLDTIVVTGRRVEESRSQTPQAIEVVDRDDLDRTIARDLTEMLKKNASVDVVQFNGVLSGIGMRGFRPEFEFAINKRSLLLVDGRPAGSTNLGPGPHRRSDPTSAEPPDWRR